MAILSFQSEMNEICFRRVREKLVYIPVANKIMRHIKRANKCDHC